jgi:hypothetical protein
MNDITLIEKVYSEEILICTDGIYQMVPASW